MKRLAAYIIDMAFVMTMALPATAADKLSGKVIERKSREPIAGAFISLIRDSSIISNTFSKEDGTFTIFWTGEAPQLISISMMGYAPVKTAFNNAPVTIELEEKKMRLVASKAVSKTIERKGDTTVFNVGAFRDKDDKVLGDLLKKLPGFAVTPSGGIVYNGAHINKFYIEGLDLLGNRYGLATSNLPSDKIAKIEVYDRHQPVKALKDIQRSNRSAVNIVLKEDAKGSWILSGDLSAGYPPLPLFDAKAMLTKFAKKSQDIMLLKGNNIGTDISLALKEQEYIGKTGAFLIKDNSFSEGLESTLTPSRPRLDLPAEYWYDNTSGLASVHHLAKLKDDLQTRFSINAAAEKFRFTSDAVQTMTFENGEKLTIRDASDMTDRKYFVTAKSETERNSPTFFLSDAFSVSGQFVRRNSSISSGDNYWEHYHLPSLKAENSLKATVRLKGRKALDITSDIRYASNDHDAYYSHSGITAQQSLSEHKFTADNKVSFTSRIRRFSIDISTGLRAMHYAPEFKLIGISEYTGGDESANVSDYKISPDITSVSAFASANGGLSFGRSSIGINIPLSINFDWSPYESLAYPVLSPSAWISTSLGSRWSSSLHVQSSSFRSAPEALAKGFVMTGYRTLQGFEGNARKSSCSAHGQLKYSDYANMFFGTATVSWRIYQTDRTASGHYTQRLSLMSYYDRPASNETLSARIALDKYFGIKTFYIRIESSYSRTASDEFVQGSMEHFLSHTFLNEVSIRFNPARWLNITAKGQYDITQHIGTVSGMTHNFSTEGSIGLYPVKQLAVKASGYYKYWKIPGISLQLQPVIKTRAEWTFRKTAIFIECRNILGADKLEESSISSYRSSTSVSRLRGREVIVGLSLSL